MTTIITEIPVLPGVADDPEGRDREKQRVEGEFQRLVFSYRSSPLVSCFHASFTFR